MSCGVGVVTTLIPTRLRSVLIELNRSVFSPEAAIESALPRLRACTLARMICTTMTSSLRLHQLVKRFPGSDRAAVDGLTIDVAAGEFYALLGPNGAGKTTTLRMIAGLLAPDFGTIEICGIDLAREPRDAKRVVAYVPDEPMLYDKLTPIEYLELIASLWDVEPARARDEAARLLDLLGLMPHAMQRCETFSRGMRQKLVLVGALIRAPHLLILDEPLTGLDAEAARLAKNLLNAHVDAGGSVILTTHILDVAERMAERIGVIRAGRLIAEGTLDQLRAHASGGHAATLEDVFLELVATPAARVVE